MGESSMRVIRGEYKKESIQIMVTEINDGWAWTATIVGKYNTYSTKFYGGFKSEKEAAMNFKKSMGQLMVGCYTREGSSGVKERMQTLLEELYAEPETKKKTIVKEQKA
jgi:hypothetical protein